VGEAKKEPAASSAEAAHPTVPPPAAEKAEPRHALPEILQGSDPKVILDRLVASDPFEVQARCLRKLRSEAVVIDVLRLAQNSMARIAIAAGSYAGREPIDEWVDLAIDLSLVDLIEEQAEEERRGVALLRSKDALFYAQFAVATGMDVVDARSACVTLNEMSIDHRQAFFRVIVEGMPLERWAQESGKPLDAIQELLRQVGWPCTAAS
jgi:DNA-directed RNA polymerase specialized sigma24 family protein